MSVSVKESDFLDQDPPLRGQNFFCISFISPEDVIRDKGVYFFHKFLSAFADEMKQFFELTIEKFKDDQVVSDSLKSLQERYDYIFDATALENEFDHFKRLNMDELEKEYHEKNDFKTTIRGVKVRGCFDSYKEATNRAEQIKKFDPAFNVFVGQVGCWCPWSPYPDNIENQEYAETQLNTLMKKYKEGQDLKNELYKLRKNDLMNKPTMNPTKVMEEKDNWMQLKVEEKNDESK